MSYSAAGYDIKPGKKEKTKWVVDNPGQKYIAPAFETVIVTPAVEEVPEVSHVEHKWKRWDHKKHELEFMWSADKPRWGDWEDTGETKTVIDQAYVAPQDAVTEEVMTDPGQPYIKKTYKEVVVSPAVPENLTPNTLTVTVDGAVVDSMAFGADVSGSYAFGDKFVAHDWSVSITAWNDDSGKKGMTKTISGTSTPCAVPIVKANPMATIDATCGVAVVTLTNVADTNTIAKDYKAEIYIDGKKVDWAKVASGATWTETYTFDEDSGTHWVVVKMDGYKHHHDVVLAKAQVESDCVAPPVLADAAAIVLLTEATCDADGSLLLGPTAYATFSEITYTGLEYSVTATADSGHTFPNGDTSITLTGTLAAQLTGDDCVAPLVITAVPPAPVFTDKCGTGDDDVMVPADTDEFVYAHTWTDNTVVVTVTATEGHELPEGAADTWKWTFTDEPCSAVVPPVKKPEVKKPVVPIVPAVAPRQLASTGVDSPQFGALAALALLIAGGTAVAIGARRRHQE